ncbi:hypothetical protein J6590_018521 [Homalodisca vitripennis]|nr:hypothetical protein J6590_018521 [Homalodisca vitripennis]
MTKISTRFDHWYFRREYIYQIRALIFNDKISTRFDHWYFRTENIYHIRALIFQDRKYLLDSSTDISGQEISTIFEHRHFRTENIYQIRARIFQARIYQGVIHFDIMHVNVTAGMSQLTLLVDRHEPSHQLGGPGFDSQGRLVLFVLSINHWTVCLGASDRIIIISQLRVMSSLWYRCWCWSSPRFSD